jgi:hypothetical protein
MKDALTREEQRVAFDYEQKALPIEERECNHCLGEKLITYKDNSNKITFMLAQVAVEPLLDPFVCPDCLGTGLDMSTCDTNDWKKRCAEVRYEFLHHKDNVLVQRGIPLGLQKSDRYLWCICLYQYELDEIGEYSCSIPSGTVPYKVWKVDLNFGKSYRVCSKPDWVMSQYIPLEEPFSEIAIRHYEVFVLEGPEPPGRVTPDWDNYERWKRDREENNTPSQYRLHPEEFHEP